MELNQAEQARLEFVMQKKQQKEFVKMFFKVTGDCFDTCITDFSSKALSPREVLQTFGGDLICLGILRQEMYR